MSEFVDVEYLKDRLFELERNCEDCRYFIDRPYYCRIHGPCRFSLSKEAIDRIVNPCIDE